SASTLIRSSKHSAARACSGGSPADGLPSAVRAAWFTDRAALPSVTGTEAPALFAPASSGGSTGSNETASRGSPPWLSSQRPSQPVLPGRVGFAVCQISIERKWLWSGLG